MRRHALLLKQLPLQGQAIQFFFLLSAAGRQKKGRGRISDLSYRAHARCDGKMYLLRAAHRGGKNSGDGACRRFIEQTHPARFVYHSVRASVPYRGDRFWRHQGRRKSRLKNETTGPQLPNLGVLERCSANELSGTDSQSEPQNA